MHRPKILSIFGISLQDSTFNLRSSSIKTYSEYTICAFSPLDCSYLLLKYYITSIGINIQRIEGMTTCSVNSNSSCMHAIHCTNRTSFFCKLHHFVECQNQRKETISSMRIIQLTTGSKLRTETMKRQSFPQ